MKTIKIIDLYILIANKEFDKLPKKIKYEDDIYYWHEEDFDYFTDDKHNFKVYLFNNHTNFILNDTVEILEEEKQETKSITKKDFETLGYACGEIQKAFTNGWTKSLENKPLKEEKKIPGKMPYKCSMGDANPREQFFVDNINTLRDKINGILDYLESKGE